MPTPARRLRVIEKLAAAGISVGVNVAPIIPGLNDQDIPKVLTAARAAGAQSAGFVLLRLPGSVKDVFSERLRTSLPLQADRVLHRIRETRGGELYDSRFGVRGRGEGTYALAIKTLFETTAVRLGLRGHD
jgi:DNA repair photolyase